MNKNVLYESIMKNIAKSVVQILNTLDEGECCGSGDCAFGGADTPYATPFNTIGVGDPIPPGMNGELGSGDLFGNYPIVKKGSTKVRRKKSKKKSIINSIATKK